MSIVYCHWCHAQIDTDFDMEHFETNTNAECIIEEQERDEQ